MSNPDVLKWKQRGHVYLWQYLDNARNYPGWHVTADEEGCASLLQLIDTMLASTYSAKAEIGLTEPSEALLRVPNNQKGSARWYKARTLTLRYLEQGQLSDHWALQADGSNVILSVGQDMLKRLRGGVEDVQAGRGDYALGPENDDSQLITFWWYLSGR